MNELYSFASGSPWLAFFLAYRILSVFVEWPMKLVNRWIRHRNVVARGWPPEHLDADGDFRTKSED